MPRDPRKWNRDSWWIAWLVTLGLHAGAILLIRILTPFEPSATPQAETVQIVFEPLGPEESASEEPKSEELQSFTELPDDRADEAPSKPAQLSNVTSRARDPVPGGDEEMPRMKGESQAPMVELTPDGKPPRPSSAPSQPLQPAQPAAAGAAGSLQQSSAAAGDQAAGVEEESDAKRESRRDTTRITDRAARQPAGNSDIDQPEMANPGGNAPNLGDVSLNTIAWNYAPWLQRFGRQLMQRWFPPPAYSLGVLKEGGWALIEVEISKSGTLLRLQVLGEEGHPSLSQAAQSALRSMAPIERLPADFPEPTLKLRIRMIYPKIRPRW